MKVLALSTLLIWFVAPMVFGFIQIVGMYSKTVLGGVSYLLEEYFEGSGTPASWVNTNSPNYDYTVTVLQGSKSYFFTTNNFGHYPFSDKDYFEAQFQFRTAALPSSLSSTVGFRVSGGEGYSVFRVNTDGRTRTYSGGSDGGLSVNAISANTTYWVKVVYDEVNRFAYTEWQSSPTFFGAGNTYTAHTFSGLQTIDRIRLGHSTGGFGSGFIVDSITVRDTRSVSVVNDNLVGVWAADGPVYNTGTTQATNGQTVETWVDTSPLAAANMTQATGSFQPIFRTNQLNGLPGVEFDGSNDFMSFAGDVSGDNGYTVYIVGSFAGSGVGFSISNNGTPNRYYGFGRAISYTLSDGSETTTTASNQATDWPTSTAKYGSIVYSGNTDRRIYLNGVETANTNSHAWPVGMNNSTLGVVRRSTSDLYRMQGFLYEVRVYNRPHGAADRTAVNNYLAAKWGL